MIDYIEHPVAIVITDHVRSTRESSVFSPVRGVRSDSPWSKRVRLGTQVVHGLSRWVRWSMVCGGGIRWPMVCGVAVVGIAS